MYKTLGQWKVSIIFWTVCLCGGVESTSCGRISDVEEEKKRCSCVGHEKFIYMPRSYPESPKVSLGEMYSNSPMNGVAGIKGTSDDISW